MLNENRITNIRNMLMQFSQESKSKSKRKTKSLPDKSERCPLKCRWWTDIHIFRTIANVCDTHLLPKKDFRINGLLTNCHTDDIIFICDNQGRTLPRAIKLAIAFPQLYTKIKLIQGSKHVNVINVCRVRVMVFNATKYLQQGQ